MPDVPTSIPLDQFVPPPPFAFIEEWEHRGKLARSEGGMSHFTLWPTWRITHDARFYGWLVWQPGKYFVRRHDGVTLDEFDGPRTNASTQPSKSARARAERALGITKG